MNGRKENQTYGTDESNGSTRRWREVMSRASSRELRSRALAGSKYVCASKIVGCKMWIKDRKQCRQEEPCVQCRVANLRG